MIDSVRDIKVTQSERNPVTRLVSLDENLLTTVASKTENEKIQYSRDRARVIAEREEIGKDFQEINYLFDLEFKYKILAADNVLDIDQKSAICHLQRIARVEKLLTKLGIINCES